MAPWPFRRRDQRPPSPPDDSPPPDPVQTALGYHQRSKHHPQRFARSLGFLDWDQQPTPFRRFEGAPTAGLPLPPADERPPVPYADLFVPGRVAPRPLDRQSLSSFFFHGLALSAWKRFGESRWSLRVDPSSGNLHPTEGWLVSPAVAGLTDTPAVLHYAPDEHLLEQRARLSDADWAALAATLPPGALLVGLTSVVWREAWKYGERAWRYCQHDVGHALGALGLSAALQGWRLTVLPDLADDAVAALLGLDREDAGHPGEREAPDLLAVLTTDGRTVDPGAIDLPALPLPDLRFAGRANRLSDEHHDWPILDVIEGACLKGLPGREPPGALVAAAPAGETAQAAAADPSPAKPAAGEDATTGTGTPPDDAGSTASASPDDDGPGTATATATPPAPLPGDGEPAGTLIRRRRSAVAMDGERGLPRPAFFALLRRLVPALCPTPHDVLPRKPAVQLALFVHRVEDLEPGLYLLARAPDLEPSLRAALRDQLVPERPPACPDDLPLWRLRAADLRGTAAGLSCSQDIAGDGAFSLGMLAHLEPTLAARGAPAYRELFWETGLIGQVLYLQAEAAGLSGTGIGCFFDDQVHQLLGLTDLTWQSLYHFAVGGRVDDPRLQDEPAYDTTRP